MPAQSPDLVALLGSRICHDLISPISAIGNGVELLMMAGAVPGPELTLISESVNSAKARIRFFRIAFGAAEAGQLVAGAEIRSILDDMTRGGRLKIAWEVAGDVERPMVKLAFLALQCLETALPYGGKVRVSETETGWRIAAEATSTKVDPALWQHLTGPGLAVGIAPAQVQFALLPAEATRHGKRLAVTLTEGGIALTF